MMGPADREKLNLDVCGIYDRAMSDWNAVQTRDDEVYVFRRHDSHGVNESRLSFWKTKTLEEAQSLIRKMVLSEIVGAVIDEVVAAQRRADEARRPLPNSHPDRPSTI